MNKLKLLLICFLCVLTLNGCSKPIIFPDESDFSVSINITNKTVISGEEVEALITFQNLTDDKYQLDWYGWLTNIIITDLEGKPIDELGLVKTLVPQVTKIKGNEKIQEVIKRKIDKPGKYKIQGVVDFTMKGNKEEKESKKLKFFIKSEPVIVEVK